MEKMIELCKPINFAVKCYVLKEFFPLNFRKTNGVWWANEVKEERRFAVWAACQGILVSFSVCRITFNLKVLHLRLGSNQEKKLQVGGRMYHIAVSSIYLIRLVGMLSLVQPIINMIVLLSKSRLRVRLVPWCCDIITPLWNCWPENTSLLSYFLSSTLYSTNYN